MQMQFQKLYDLSSQDGSRLVCFQVFGPRVVYWRDRALNMMTPYDECCRQVAKEANSVSSQNLQTMHVLDMVCFEDQPSLLSCVRIADPRPQNI